MRTTPSSLILPLTLSCLAASSALAQQEGVEPAISGTSLTFRSHQLGAGASGANLEGAACPANTIMISGSCHPGYSDGVRILNQWPNVAARTWRCGFANRTAQSRSVWIYTLCAESGPSIVQHQLQVRRYTTTNLTNAEADSILADAGTVLQNNDGSDDVACAVGFSRNGNVTAFTDGDGSIDSSGEFNTVIGLPGHVKAVNQINWCGGLIPNVIGCAPVPGNSLAVVRFTSSLEGILWAHEYGHNKGRSHRNDVNAVMHPSIASSRLRVNTDECNAFSTLPATLMASTRVVMPQTTAGPMAGRAAEPAAQPATEPAGDRGVDGTLAAEVQAPQDVREFVRQIYYHGVPFEQASQYDESAIPVLVEMLNDPAEEPYWANVVVVLGMIGEEAAVEPMIGFIEAKTDDQISREHYVAKTSALMSLGYIVNQAGSERALNYLRESAAPAQWEGADVGRAPFQASATERNVDMAKHAILGLALAGTPEAAEALRSLQERAPRSEADRAFQTQMSDLVSEALRENQQIAENGLAEYYRHRRQ